MSLILPKLGATSAELLSCRQSALCWFADLSGRSCWANYVKAGVCSWQHQNAVSVSELVVGQLLRHF